MGRSQKTLIVTSLHLNQDYSLFRNKKPKILQTFLLYFLYTGVGDQTEAKVGAKVSNTYTETSYVQTSVFERLRVRTIRFSNRKFEMKMIRSSNKNRFSNKKKEQQRYVTA